MSDYQEFRVAYEVISAILCYGEVCWGSGPKLKEKRNANIGY